MQPPAPRAAFNVAARLPPRALPPKNLSILQHMSWIDMVIFLAWVVATTMPFPMVQPLRYLAAAYFAGSMVIMVRQTMPAALRAWPALIIPILCIVSALWAPYPNEAIRKGILLALTAIVAIYVASRLSGRQILTVLMLAESIALFVTVAKPNLDNGAWTGIFGQKNFLAVHMFLLFAPAMALLLDKATNRWIRLYALAMVPGAILAIYMAKSGTTTLLLIGSFTTMLGHAFLWQPAARIRHMRMLLLLALSALLLAAVFLLFGIMQFDAADEIFKFLGKDSTLTGRTYLWQTAERIMAEKPWTGVGAEGFWRPEYGAANSITEYFFYERYTHFSFHNSYLENGVSLGYPGYWATVFLAGWAIVCATMTWVRNQSIVNAAFFIISVMIVIRSTAEVDLAQEFTGTLVLLIIGAVRREKLEPGAPVRTALHVPTGHASPPPMPARSTS